MSNLIIDSNLVESSESALVDSARHSVNSQENAQPVVPDVAAAPAATVTGNAEPAPTLPVSATPGPPPAEAPLKLNPVLGRIEALSPAEQQELMICEAAIAMMWESSIGAGEALAKVETKELYRQLHDSFEEYCQNKWQIKRRQVFYLMAAARLYAHLCTNCALRKPSHASQLRPMAGLTPEQAKLTWDRAVEKAGTGRLTAQHVRRAMEELNLARATKRATGPPRQTIVERRRQIDSSIGELLALAARKADHALLIEKIEELHRRFQSFFVPSTTAKT